MEGRGDEAMDIKYCVGMGDGWLLGKSVDVEGASEPESDSGG